MARLLTFNKEIIRTLMYGTRTLDQGIAYAKAITPTLTDSEAKEVAIRLAQDYCYQKWANDSTGYIRDEAIAFQEFKSDVDHNRYFAIPKEILQKQEAEKNEAETKERQEKHEKHRVERLTKYCNANNLCFEVENYKELKRLKRVHILCTLSMIFATLIGIVILGYMLLSDNLTFWRFAIVAVAWFVILMIAFEVEPDLPPRVYDALKHGIPVSKEAQEERPDVWICGNCKTENSINYSQCKKCGKYKSYK